MASLQERKRKNGKAYLIQFSLNGARRSLFLDGKYTREMAEDIKGVVEKCVDAIETDNSLDRRTLAWLENVNDDLRARLIACGLVEEDDPGGAYTVRELFDLFLEKTEKTRKASTLMVYERAGNAIFRFIDGSLKVGEFQRKQALDLVERLTQSRYAPTTRALYICTIKAVFNMAVDREIIDKSPFVRIPCGNTRNKNREFYIDSDFFGKMLDACRTAQERTLLTFYRVAGMRCSEAVLVTWRDVDFEKGRLVVHSPKTERIDGRAQRIIPLFPAVRKTLLEQQKEETILSLDDRIIPVSRRWAWCFIRGLLKRKGLPQYPRLVQNLRSSASIDIYRRYGELAENNWLGHSAATAKEHYLHVLDSEFQRAVEDEGGCKNGCYR